MVDGGGASVETADVVSGPQGAEPLTGQCEFSDEFDEPGVVGVVPDGGAKSGDEAGGGFGPVLVKGLFLGIEKKGTKPVQARPQARGERDGGCLFVRLILCSWCVLRRSEDHRLGVLHKSMRGQAALSVAGDMLRP